MLQWAGCIWETISTFWLSTCSRVGGDHVITLYWHQSLEYGAIESVLCLLDEGEESRGFELGGDML